MIGCMLVPKDNPPKYPDPLNLQMLLYTMKVTSQISVNEGSLDEIVLGYPGHKCNHNCPYKEEGDLTLIKKET